MKAFPRLLLVSLMSAAGAAMMSAAAPALDADQESGATNAVAPVSKADWAACEASIAAGRPKEALGRIAAALALDPDNPRLLYNHGVAAYAAGRREDALLSWDRAESASRGSVALRARFQKGNAEYQIGLAAKASNMDDTIARWKEALLDYQGAEEGETGPSARHNAEVVRRRLLALLLDAGRTNLANAQPPETPMERKLDALRNAFNEYTNAKNLAPDNDEASAGEAESRAQLANTLAAEGSRKAQTTRWVQPKPTEAPLPHPDFKEVREGVAMLEDAHELKPKDAAIAKALEDGRKRLADAYTDQAENLMEVEPRIQWPNEKLAILRMAKEHANQALTASPKHPRAQRALDAANQRLSQVMEQQGDELSSQSEQATLEQSAQQLSQALDFFQQAGELRPESKQLPQKASTTQGRLEQALDKLAEHLMQKPENQESLEAQAARLEGASQALQELERLAPSQRTSERAENVGRELDGVRQQMAKPGPGQQPGGQQPGGQQAGGQQPDPRGRPGGPPRFLNGLPIDTPPRINTPGEKGTWNSPVMNKTQDY